MSNLAAAFPCHRRIRQFDGDDKIGFDRSINGIGPLHDDYGHISAYRGLHASIKHEFDAHYRLISALSL